MTPGKYNIVCPQGATFSKRLTWSIDEVPINLAGYTARMQVKESHKSLYDPAVNITTENGGILLDDEGNIDLLISATATANIYAKDYVYDLELITGSTVYRVIEGKFIVTPEVTT
jgi:hypothetical protein